MKFNKTLVIIAGSAAALFATDARIANMGGSDYFFRDHNSIYRNPADIGRYDRILIGSYGVYDSIGTAVNEFGNPKTKYGSKLPSWGGTFSIKKDKESVSKFIVGATFNRSDSLLNYLTPGHKDFLNAPSAFVAKDSTFATSDTITYINGDSLAGKVDVMLGYTLNNGMTIGVGSYFAMQSNKSDAKASGPSASLVKGTIGLSGPISESIDLETSFSAALLNLKGWGRDPLNTSSTNPEKVLVTAQNDMALSFDIRAISDVPAINGAFIPHVQANYVSYDVDEAIIDLNAGLGINIFIDRGFFACGFEGFYKDRSSALVGGSYSPTNQYGGRVTMGIERNVITDWLVWRIGGAKVIGYESFDGGNKGSHFVFNSDQDVVSFGIGVNIENRAKIDAVIAESSLYTLGNIFSGDNENIISRISATFDF